MEKPGLEPPPPAFPNKGLIEAGPAPCHAGARCWEPVVPRWGGRAVLGGRGATTVRSARWAAAIAEPPVSSPLSGCGLGLPVLQWGGGHQLGAKSNGSGDRQPWHRAAFMAGKQHGLLDAPAVMGDFGHPSPNEGRVAPSRAALRRAGVWGMARWGETMVWDSPSPA